MTDQELDEIQARADAATPGPWHVQWDGLTVRTTDADDHESPSVRVAATSPSNADVEHHVTNAEFIAEARSDVPALVAEVKRLRAQNAAPEGR